MRVKGSRNLDDAGKHVLKHLYAYRNGQAKKLDRPPYKVIPDQFLLRVAEMKPDNQDKIRGLAKRRSNMLRRHGESLVKAVQAGLKEKGPVPEPAKKTQRGPRMPYGGRDSERLVQELKNWRTKFAAKESIPVAMLASNAQLKVLAGFRPKTLEELEKLEDIRAWQTRRYGTEWLAVLESFSSKRPAASPTDDAPPAKRRRRRRRRRNGGNGEGGSSNSEG
jgi:ribonuclease D